MAEWKFVRRQPNGIDQDLTQRDQFHNDEIGLAEALVRETIQNSLDASSDTGNPVRVRFSRRTVSGPAAKEIRNISMGLRDHLEAANIDTHILDGDSVDILVIEDFETTGLTGEVNKSTPGGFKDFWRRLGGSEKHGRKGGRWGLGKLVFSTSSEIKSFFGLTIRENDDGPYFLGQSALKNHEIGADQYQWCGFYANHDEEDYQHPIADAEEVQNLADLLGITRTVEPGLSIAVIYVSPAITPDHLLKGVLKNYFFPIISGDLVVTIDSDEINSKNFDSFVEKSGLSSNVPIDFIRDVSREQKFAPDCEGEDVGIDPSQPDEAYFSQEDLEKLRAKYISRKLIHVRLPLELTRKNGESLLRRFDLFLRRHDAEASPYVMFVRDRMVVPGEGSKVKSGMSNVSGAMIASDKDVVSFLGDAENPAHTGWNLRAEKLRPNWKKPEETLKSIRFALLNLYRLLDQEEERMDPDALRDFFSIPDSGEIPGLGNEHPPVDSPPPGPRYYRISKRNDGVSIGPGPNAGELSLPKSVRVRIAFDMFGANPFNRHSPYDFDLRVPDVELESNGVEVEVTESNSIGVTIQDADFSINFSGFDPHRDLIVKIDDTDLEDT